MKKILYTTLLAAFGWCSVHSQNITKRSCGTMEHLEMQMKSDPGLKARMEAIEVQTREWIASHPQNKTQVVITIPVVVHVVWNTASQNISDAQVLSQIEVLNEDFARLNADAANTPAAWTGIAANTQIQFCMAQRDPNGNATTGIVRKQTATTSFSSNDNIKRTANGGDDAWPASQYLNIWSGNLSGGLLGYAQFPGGTAATDGVVILYNAFGRVGNVVAPFHKGRTATHEVGHWLNLYHIWGDDGTSCNGSDQVTDTPNQSSENYNCPAYPHTDNCSASNPGVMFMNYMDYTDDACMNIFTNGQSTRMNAALNGTRVSILSSQGCVPPGGGSCSTPSGLSASSITTSTATLNWNTVAGASSYNVRYRIVNTATWTNTTSASNSKAISGLSGASNYEFQVQAVCSGSSSSFSASGTFTTSSAACTDNYEPNNTLATAVTAPKNTDITALINVGTDKDFFKFTTGTSNPNVKITLTNLPADYDLKLTNGGGGTVYGTSQNGGTSNETIILNTTVARTYKIKVYPYTSASYSPTQCYTMRISTSNSGFRTESGTETIASETEQLLLVYPNPAKDNLTIQFNSSLDGNSNLRVYDMLGRNVLNQTHLLEKGINKFDLNLSELIKGIYFLEVNNGAEKEIKKVVVDK